MAKPKGETLSIDFNTVSVGLGLMIGLVGVVLAWLAKRRSEPDIEFDLAGGVGCYYYNDGEYHFKATVNIRNKSAVSTTLNTPVLLFTEQLYCEPVRLPLFWKLQSKDWARIGLFYVHDGRRDSLLRIEAGDMKRVDLEASALMGIPATWKLSPKMPDRNVGEIVGILRIENGFGQCLYHKTWCTIAPWRRP